MDREAKIKAHNAKIAAMKHWRRYDVCDACKADPGTPCLNQLFKNEKVYRQWPHGVRPMVNA